ncbi:MAG: DUF1320 family protein [Thiogranum sp.]|nr:DUF1320 family protein [Thiogranum sp.]
MTYCNTDDLADLLGTEARSENSIVCLVAADIAAAIDEAQAEVDFAFAAIGDEIPVTPVTSMVANFTKDIARARLYDVLLYRPDDAQAVSRAAWRARRILDMLASGVFASDDAIGPAVIELVTGDQATLKSTLKKA